MVKYDAQYIETRFREVATLRISQKRGGDERYKGDAGYWDGGRCDYGAAHNFQEDCRTLAKFFGDITELKEARKRLTSFNDQKEFDETKQDLLNKANKAVNGLQMRTGANSSVGGICIIWDDFSDYLNLIVEDFRREVESLRNDIERVSYNEAKELQKLDREERKLQKEIEENEKKARNESDPDKKKKFIFLANQAKEKWKKVLERKKQLKSSNLGDDFNPDKHIDDFLNRLKEKLSGKNRPPRNPANPNPQDPNNPTDPEVKVPNPQDPFKTKQKTLQNFFQTNKTLMLIAAALLVTFYLMSQKQEKEPNYYDF